MHKYYKRIIISLAIGTVLMLSGAHSKAIGSTQNPQAGSMGLEATIPSPPPTQAASIAVPANGTIFTSLPITVSGLCPGSLLIKIFSNNIFVGSTLCSRGSYSLKIDLFNGSNDLYAQDFDNLGQSGPLSAQINVTYNPGNYAAPLDRITITSVYAERGANPGSDLTWPIAISGGAPPYAVSTDWGDGQPATLQPVNFSGNFTIKHVYSTAGVYPVIVSATDSQGATAFLQLVGVANGQIVGTSSSKAPKSGKIKPNNTTVPAWFLLIVLAALVPAFWLGSRHGRAILLKKFNS